MTVTLLIDLDDTLVENHIETFLPAYLKLLADHLAPYIDPRVMVKTLLAATEFMARNTQPGRTLEAAFDSHFFPSLGMQKSDLQPIFDTFYEKKFSSLRDLSRPKPDAVAMLQQAFDRGYRIGIATNPLFPRSAILQRLEWAGFSPDLDPIALVPDFERFHFSKPQPAYYAEFLGQMGWPEGPVVMIGDDPVNDIEAARQAGLAAYWASSQPQAWEGPGNPPPSGSLDEFLSWLDNTPPEQLLPDFTSPSALLAVLRATPGAISSLGSRFSAECWSVRPEPEEWSVTEVLCHLRDVEAEVNLPRLQKVLHEHNPFLPGKDTDPWADERNYAHQDGFQAWQDFTASRAQLLDLLENLNPAGWQRLARHAIFGPTDLQELVTIIVGHDRLHVQQVFNLFSSNWQP